MERGDASKDHDHKSNGHDKVIDPKLEAFDARLEDDVVEEDGEEEANGSEAHRAHEGAKLHKERQHGSQECGHHHKERPCQKSHCEVPLGEPSLL